MRIIRNGYWRSQVDDLGVYAVADVAVGVSHTRTACQHKHIICRLADTSLLRQCQIRL